MPTITGNNPKYAHKSQDDRQDTIALVAKLSRMGLTQKEIVLQVFKIKEINITQNTVCQYLKIVRERYKQATLESRGEQVERLVAVIEDVRTEAWFRFHQTGDKEFLDVISKTVDQECKVRGLIEPDRKTFNTMVNVGNTGQFPWDVLVQEIAERNNTVQVQEPLIIEGDTEQHLPSANGDGH